MEGESGAPTTVNGEEVDMDALTVTVKAEERVKETDENKEEAGGEEEYVEGEEDPYDDYVPDKDSESSEWEDDIEDSDYCPSEGDQEEAMVSQQQFLDSLMDDEDAPQLVPAPPKKKRKQHSTKKRPTRNISEQVRGLTGFKAEVVKSVLRLQARKERLRSKQLTADINKPINYLVEDPGLYHDIQYDSSSGKITLGHVEIALDGLLQCLLIRDSPFFFHRHGSPLTFLSSSLVFSCLRGKTSSLICTGCGYTTHRLTNSTYKYKLSEKVRHLVNHILGKHLEAFKCAICGTVVTSLARYKDHIGGHQMQFVCDQCGKSVSSKGALQTHKWRFHMTEEEIQKALANGEKDPRVRLQRFMEKQAQFLFQCPTCEKKFGTKTQLKTHQETHLDKSERKLYICPQCGKSFTKGSWISHQQNTCRPEGAQTFYCEQCPPEKRKGFASKALLKRHVDRHLDKKSYPCSTCSMRFKTSGELKRHEVVHSDLRPFICQHGCGVSFKNRKDCIRHEKSRCKVIKERGSKLTKIKISNDNDDTNVTDTTTEVEMKPELESSELDS